MEGDNFFLLEILDVVWFGRWCMVGTWWNAKSGKRHFSRVETVAKVTARAEDVEMSHKGSSEEQARVSLIYVL